MSLITQHEMFEMRTVDVAKVGRKANHVANGTSTYEVRTCSMHEAILLSTHNIC
jgi:hypothetical protein